MPGGKHGLGKDMGNDFLRSKPEKRQMNGLIIFIPDLLPVSRRDSMRSRVVEKEVQAA
jgi:hypothetical protein